MGHSPIFPVSSAHTTLEWETVWICFSKSWIPCPSEHGPQGRGRAAQKWDIQSGSASEAIVWDQGNVLGLLLHAGLASALKLIGPPGTNGSAWLSLLLQRPQLAAPNLNPPSAPPGKSRVGDFHETMWFGSGVGATFSSMST